MRKQFDAIAGSWDELRSPEHLAPYEAALAAVDPAPARALDLGTGTGAGAFANMIPFFDEFSRVLAPGGQAVFAFSFGPETPIYVTPERLKEELGRRGFAEFAEFAAGQGTALLARKEIGA